MTGIQVVRNSGWLIPYVACSITALGMLAHFFGTLTRFLKRRERETKAELERAFESGPGTASGPIEPSRLVDRWWICVAGCRSCWFRGRR